MPAFERSAQGMRAGTRFDQLEVPFDLSLNFICVLISEGFPVKQVFRLSLTVAALILVCGVSAFAQDPTVTQLTQSDKDTFATDISGDGRYVVLESTGDIGSKISSLNSDNVDGNREIFIFDVQQGFCFQITHTRSALRNPGGSSTDRANILVEISNNKPVISHDGRWLAFGSNADNPKNFDGNAHPELSSDANSEIFLYQIPTTPQNLTTGTFRRITDTPASRPPQGGTSTTSPIFADDNRNPALNDNGTLVAFVSTRDILPGHNAEDIPNPEIFIFNRSTGGFSQLTETEGMFTFNENPSLSGAPPPSNTVVAFISNANLTQNNADGNAEVYVANFNGATTTSISQATRTSAPSTANPVVNVLSPGRRLSRNGNFIAFESTANLTGDGSIQSTFAMFSYNIGTNTFTQVGQRSTPGTEVGLRFPTYTGDNSRFIFGSALNFNSDGTIATGSGGLNFNRAINIFSTPVPGPGTPVSLTQLTRIPLFGSPGQRQPSLQAFPADTQNRIAFTVPLNLTNGNPDNSFEPFYVVQPSTAPAPMHVIGGQVKVGASGPALSGATVTITSSTSGFAPRTAQTNSAGNYTFSDLPSGRTYTVKSAKTNYTFTPTEKSFTALNANQTANFTATATTAPRTYNITGRVTNISGKGLQGVTVKLTGTRTLTVTTNSQGNYSFTSLPAGGNYTVRPTLAGKSFDPLSKTFSNLSANQTTASFLVVYSILGRVVRAGTATGIGGVTVKLSGPRATTTTTDSNGNYRFDKLPAGGNYSIQPTKSGMSFSPGVQKFPLLDSNKTASHFNGTP